MQFIKNLKNKISERFNLIKNAIDKFYWLDEQKVPKEYSTPFIKENYEKEAIKELYDEKENQFLADRFIEGECPKCGYKEAYGDQCESCGSSLNATDLINPKSKLSGNKPIFKKTKHGGIIG